MKVAEFRGRNVPSLDDRIEAIVALWSEPIPGLWKRDQDPRLLNPERRYCRTHTGGDRVPRGEHAIEQEILGSGPEITPTMCLGGRLIDGVNAVPLAKDAGGGRAGNVEADMLLLVADDSGYKQLLVEVKARSNHPWYAAVEVLRQLRLFSKSVAPQCLFHTRRPDLTLPHSLPTTAVVLAPAPFYSAPGRNAATIAPSEALLERLRTRFGVDARLATWDQSERLVQQRSAT
ncbi:MAG: hypothetical protein M3417_01700 [Actinomycetota bacterium]|nr:hypothetical protein [Actinomycetota bacterium]